MIWLELFLGFLKVGIFAFGGAYGAIPLIRDIVLSYNWMSEEEFVCMIAVSESTPGPIMVNLATCVGCSQAGIPGALIATFAVVLPSFLIILLVTLVLKHALKNKYIQALLRGIRPCITGIVLAVGIFMLLTNCAGKISAPEIDLRAVIIALILGAAMITYKYAAKKKLSPIVLIMISAIAGMIVYGM